MSDHQLAEFWEMTPSQRESTLLEAIAATHQWHYARNISYRRTVSARGIGSAIGGDNGGAELTSILARLLRPTAQTFKSYIDILGTPFAQDRPLLFLEWLAEQLSVVLPRERFSQFRNKYRSLEALLRDIERVFADLGLEVLTSSGTSGRSTIMVRDQEGMDKTVESFYLSFQRHLGMRADHRAIFIMPRHTRIAMARMAGFSVKRVGLAEERVHFSIPFPAEPDQVRIRAGRTFRPGWRGSVERRLLYPFMNRMQDQVVTPRAVRTTLELLRRAEAAGEKVLVFGGWIQLHAVSRALHEAGQSLRLAPGSIIGTGGGMKELYPVGPSEIRQELSQVIALADDQPVPIRDVYGMAEGNWAAMQCQEGSYHLPPWVYAVTLDEDGEVQRGPDTTGILAFFDPYGGGQLFPAFFRSGDRVRLVNGDGRLDLVRAVRSQPVEGAAGQATCPCGETGSYLKRESIRRVDLVDEAGCAAQV